MPAKVVSNTPKFVVFDLQKLSATQHMIFGADYVLIRPKSTGCTLHLANSHYRLKIGQLVLLAPFNPFRLSLDKESSSSRKVLDCDVLHFKLSALGQTFVDSKQFSDIKSMLDYARHGLLYEGPEITEIGKHFNKIKNSFKFNQVLNILTILDMLSKHKPSQCLLVNCIQIHHVKHQEDKLKAVLEYIKDNLTEQLTVLGVASQFFMAESTFSRFFHANMGISFWQYVIEQRIRLATKLLVKTDKSISFICAEVGFSSISSFNTKFKELLKITPKQYRKRYLEISLDDDAAPSVIAQVKKQVVNLVENI